MTGENPSENFDARWRAVGVTVVAIVVMGLGITRTIRRWQRQATLAQTIMTYEGKGKGKGYTPVDGSLPPEQQARAAVAQMVEQLDAGDYAAFIEAHGPIDELNRSSGSSRSAGSERLADLFREMQTWSFTVAPGNVNKVVLSDPTPDPPVPNRYAEIIDWDPNWDPTSRSSKRPPPGYGQPYRVGVNETLELAIADLEQGKYERFMEHMFPPSVTAMMKADERWTGLVASMTAQSPLVTRMIEDLKEMLIATPEMSGKNYASYRLPRRVEVDGQERVVGKKFISLNRIAHWRFTDEKTKKFRRAYGTMLSQTASRHEFVLEKANGQWRLPYIP